MAGKNIAHLVQEEGVDKDTSFRAQLEKESCIAVLEAHRWRSRRDLSRGVGRNISGIRGDRLRRAVEHTGALWADRDVLERLVQDSLRDRWALWLGTRKVTGVAQRLSSICVSR